jgi:hypothetical protein
MLQHKSFFMNDYTCAMCNHSTLETGEDHLFFPCPFAVNCWQYLCPKWVPPAATYHNIQDTMLSLRTAIDKPFYMEIIMLVALGNLDNTQRLHFQGSAAKFI